MVNDPSVLELLSFNCIWKTAKFAHKQTMNRQTKHKQKQSKVGTNWRRGDNNVSTGRRKHASQNKKKKKKKKKKGKMGSQTVGDRKSWMLTGLNMQQEATVPTKND